MWIEPVSPDFIITKEIVKLIMFLLRTYTTVEIKILAIELEIAVLV